jgi:rSAM/selenodomain-associated transferase 2
MRNRGHEIIVVDGYSEDDTISKAKSFSDLVLVESRGRARQMNKGAQTASGDIFWFLHADSLPPENADDLILKAINRGKIWGRFDVRLSGPNVIFRIIEFFMNLRSRITGIATGDQSIFVQAKIFKAIGGFQEIPIMEDISLSKMLKKHGKPACLRSRIVTSSRRWENHGIFRTILTMWYLRLLYAIGVKPDRLTGFYR